MNLRQEPWKQKSNPSNAVAYILLLSGTIALVTSIIYSSTILAFIGLGLTFWGAILLYIRPTKYVKASLLDSTVISSLKTIDQMLTELNYKGKAVYFPPKYLKETKGGKVFIQSKEGLVIPPAEGVAEEKTLSENLKRIRLTPPGLGLANLYENELRKDFTQVDLNYLQNNLPKLFTEDLEIAENLEINVESNMIKVKLTGSIYQDLCTDARRLPNIHGSIGCPICSSIAIALTRATGNPIVIEQTEVPKDGKTIEANFRLLETPEPQEQTKAVIEEAIHLYRRRLIRNLSSSFLTVLGVITLSWVGWFTWYDLTVWGKEYGKDIALIFFGSRTGEAISLGIDMRVIYYFLIGLALLLSGLLTFLRRRRSKV